MTKRLKQRLYTFDQLHARVTKARGPVQIYGSLYAEPVLNKIAVYWNGDPRRVGVPDVFAKNAEVPIANVYDLSDGESGYVIQSNLRLTRPLEGIDRAKRKIWKRYVRAFTPYDGTRLLWRDKRAPQYRVKQHEDGSTQATYVGTSHDILFGVWGTRTVAPERFDKDKVARYPRFYARCRRFFNDLRKGLKDGPECRVEMYDATMYDGQPKVIVNAYLPPTRTQESKCLRIYACIHKPESRRRFGISVDWAKMHSHYMAGELHTDKAFEWKCGKDALAGVTEWVLSSLHIPGPDL